MDEDNRHRFPQDILNKKMLCSLTKNTDIHFDKIDN